jgi:multiple sugar transport system permease protein
MTTVAQRGHVQPSGLRRAEARWALLFLAPSLIGFLVFTAFPVASALLLSLARWDLISAPAFIGLGNYLQALKDPLFWRVLANTVYYTIVTVPCGIAVSLLLAVALNEPIRGRLGLRAVYFLPVISSTVAVAMVWRWIYNPDFGLLNFVLARLHLPTPGWLISTTWAMPAVIIMSVWKDLGYGVVIFLAGLQGIPQHLYDAAAVDGANRRQQLWRITLPLLSPTTFFVAIIYSINSFQVFGQIYMMTQGGPNYATSTMVYYVYQNAFQFFKMGYASALAWVLFACIFVFTLIQMRYQTWVHYE